ncbi:protein tweety homolog 2-like isoform X3 [Syngnathus typhle]|uniref:protein tweety homolog 2-like isoform X3 n=1 Tax=Syngnathus typhle TaxID=161592 RepID=UPI002A69FE32|nr:protein tweety homolog 2-like isoform X3 [Syngnathus typhle]
MATASLNYVAPWWIYWLHNLPHLDLSLKPVDSTFRPEQEDYQQSVVVLACVGAVGLSLSLVLLVLFLVCSRICRRDAHKDVKRPERTRCATWSAVVTALIVCCAVAVGFYGNSETNDGVHRFTYSISNANRTLGGIDSLSAGSLRSAQTGVQRHLERLDEILAARADYLQALHFVRLMVNNVIRELNALPNVDKANMGLTAAAAHATFVEYYRWLTYLLLLILELLICLAVCLGMTKQSRRLLVMMMALAVLSVILSWTSLGASWATAVSESTQPLPTVADGLPALADHHADPDPGFAAVLHARLPHRRERPVRHPALVECQRIQSAPADSLARLSRTAQGLPGRPNGRMLRWRGRPPLPGFVLPAGGVRALCHAVCHLASVDANRQQVSVTGDKEYDDIDEEDPFNPQARRMSYNARRSNIHSFCSYTSSAGSQASIHPSPQADAAVPPAPEYMNQSMLFGGSPRYENVPLICRGSPPPSYSPGTRTTYLSTTEVQIR